MRRPSHRVSAAIFAFGWAGSRTENNASESLPELPRRLNRLLSPDDGEPIQRPSIPIAQSFDDLCRSVAFAPVTVGPVLEASSRCGLLRHLADNDPIRREGAADNDEVRVWVCVDETERVQNTAIAEPSGNAEVDAFAQAALTNLSFTPAEFEGHRVPTWISLPVVLGPG